MRNNVGPDVPDFLMDPKAHGLQWRLKVAMYGIKTFLATNMVVLPETSWWVAGYLAGGRVAFQHRPQET